MISQSSQRLSDPRIDLFLSALRWQHQETGLSGHGNRVRRLAMAIGQALSLSPESLKRIHMASLLHDLGKFHAPEDILNKPGPLTRRERDILQQHTTIGDDLCDGLPFLQEIGPIIRHHHERWDGSGYPDGLVGDTTPLESQIIHAADVADALLSPRCYRPAKSLDETLRIIMEEIDRGWHNPALMKTALPIIATICKSPASPLLPSRYEGIL